MKYNLSKLNDWNPPTSTELCQGNTKVPLTSHLTTTRSIEGATLKITKFNPLMITSVVPSSILVG